MALGAMPNDTQIKHYEIVTFTSQALNIMCLGLHVGLFESPIDSEVLQYDRA